MRLVFRQKLSCAPTRVTQKHALQGITTREYTNEESIQFAARAASMKTKRHYETKEGFYTRIYALLVSVCFRDSDRAPRKQCQVGQRKQRAGTSGGSLTDTISLVRAPPDT